MQDLQLAIETNLKDLQPNAWFGALDDLFEDHGFFEQLGTKHFAGFLEAGNKLLVTFENAVSVREDTPTAEPRGFSYARHDGWSHLALLSEGDSWFRDKPVYDFFDRLTDEGFFDDFERVVFHGANGGAYAAAAFSIVAPGATVVALRPQATLDAQIAGWDTRYKDQRIHDFSDRYGYAPDMAESANDVFIAYDPTRPLDAMHAALFNTSNVTRLPCPLQGEHLDQAFDRLGIHDILLKLVMDQSLDQKRFVQLLRARRYDQTYAKSLVAHLVQAGHPGLAKVICNYMLQRGENKYFTQALARLNEQIAA